MKVIITGVAGFIGYHLAKHLSDNGFTVIGIDNVDSPLGLKQKRLDRLNIKLYKLDITQYDKLAQVFEKHKDFSAIIHLAAQAGVSDSFTNPDKCIHTNMVGFQNILNAIKTYNNEAHLVYASSSSVYGDSDHPRSLYGVTKIANEMMAGIYADEFNMACTGLRFHTVYGPWGRPDMAIYKFVDAIEHNKPVELFNLGENTRDFTYIDDVVDAIELALLRDFESDPFATYDIGSGTSISINKTIDLLEVLLNKKAKRWLDVAKMGDVTNTCANIEKAENELGFVPKVNFKEGLDRFIKWYRWYKDEYPLEEN